METTGQPGPTSTPTLTDNTIKPTSTVQRTPDGGSGLTHGRRTTLRDARTWLRSEGVAVGRLPECSEQVEWLEGAERREFLSHLRHSEGRDCNVGGDVLLYTLCDGGRVAVVEVG